MPPPIGAGTLPRPASSSCPPPRRALAADRARWRTRAAAASLHRPRLRRARCSRAQSIRCWRPFGRRSAVRLKAPAAAGFARGNL
eukprot:1807518-Prymnesium_polylepis.1